MSKKKRITVAEFIAQQVALTDKTQKEIAAAVGYDRPNFITMIKKGQSKLPISKAVPLAKALGVDPIHMLRLVLQEYQPEVWTAVEQVADSAGKEILTQEERTLLEIARKESFGIPLALSNPRNREKIEISIRAIALLEEKEREDVRRYLEGLPANSRVRRPGA